MFECPCAVLVAWTSFGGRFGRAAGSFGSELSDNEPVSSELSSEEKSNTLGMKVVA
jgi:hypothetical protein